MAAPLEILVVCKGNLCRSPMAEAVLHQRLRVAGLPAFVRSAGTAPWHVDDPAEPLGVATLTRRGYVVRPHRARRIRASDFASPRLIMGVDLSVRAALQRLAPPARRAAIRPLHPDLDIPDPYYEGEKAFEDVLDLIEAAVEVRMPTFRYLATGEMPDQSAPPRASGADW